MTTEQLTNILKDLKQVKNDYQYSYDKVGENVELLKPLVNCLDKHSRTIKDLEQVLGQMRKIEEKQKNRIYTPRILKED